MVGSAFRVLFASTGYHGSDPGILVQHPLVSFSKALELLTRHIYKAYHKSAIVRADEFCNQQSDIRCRMNQAMADRVISNQMKLASIVQTIVFCGRQNIPLCGYRDSATDLDRDATENHGNFWALLRLRVESGDTILEEYHSTRAKMPRIHLELFRIRSLTYYPTKYNKQYSKM